MNYISTTVLLLIVLFLITSTASSQHYPSKLSIHSGYQQLSREFMKRSRPRLIKLFDNFEPAKEIKSIHHNYTTIICRKYWAEQPVYSGDPVEESTKFWNSQLRQYAIKYPDCDYWEGYNEINPKTVEQTKWYSSFEKNRLELMTKENFKACIGNFATGNPDIPMWQYFLPALQSANDHGSLLCLHEYSWPRMNYLWEEKEQEGWLTGRYRKIYRLYLQPNHLTNVTIAITECGLDGGVTSYTGHGWRDRMKLTGIPTNAEIYINEEMGWYDNIIKQDDYVLGCTIFSLDIPGWDSFDLGQDGTNALIQYYANKK